MEPNTASCETALTDIVPGPAFATEAIGWVKYKIRTTRY